MKKYDQKAYKLPPPTPAQVPAETIKRPLEEMPGPSSKRSRVFIIPVIRPSVAPVLIISPEQIPPEQIPPEQIPPEQIPPEQIPPVQIPPELTTPIVQIFRSTCTDTNPLVVETFEPTLTDESSIDQIMSSEFGDCSQPGLPPAHTQEPQLYNVRSLFDCARAADVCVKWFTWLDDWEMHRDDNVPWRRVGLQPWKRALEKTRAALA
ncbi:hypothetical protein TNCV_2560221 [Trichonephila clavipes]|uniref:Uncharacterized protein n=1 Tax=Trichonephila clavipes TaxID=2585209 RepID=A0A8X6R246_TRICX|nr:hypothetical protein TNCV_2560221 [Trichonephila clavipes]